MPKLPPMRQSNSSGNLIDSRYYLSDDQNNTLLRSAKMSTTERKGGLVKRTKSFWRFGRQNSDNEILEGMALWKHRDLVDVNEKQIEAEKKKTMTMPKERPVVRKRRPSRDRSNDSDKTLNAKQQYEESKNGDVTMKAKEPTPRHRPSFNEKQKQKLSLPPRQEYKESKVDSDFDAHFENNPAEDDQFYDDGDGLMLRTVNRKNILQQYSNDSTGSESDSESIITSDDPYDCIVVDDQTTKKVKKNGTDKFPNVAEIGKKLEKLSKNTKYSPDNKESVNNNNSNQFSNSMNEKNNNVSLRNERNMEKNINAEAEKREIIKYRDSYSEQRHSFATFGHEDRSAKADEQSEHTDNRNNKKTTPGKPTPKQRYCPEPNERNNVKQESRSRSQNNHEKSKADAEKREKRIAAEPRRKINSEKSERKEKLKYYSERVDASGDEYSDSVVENRQFLPRTKLAKTSTSTMHDSSYEHESGLMDYGETLQNRLKSPDYGSKFDEKSPATGNMYGPWYDLWGLDASVRK